MTTLTSRWRAVLVVLFTALLLPLIGPGAVAQADLQPCPWAGCEPAPQLDERFWTEGKAKCFVSRAQPWQDVSSYARGAARVYCYNGSYSGTTPFVEQVRSQDIDAELQVRNPGSTTWHIMDYSVFTVSPDLAIATGNPKYNNPWGRSDAAGEVKVDLFARCNPDGRAGEWRVKIVSAAGHRQGYPNQPWTQLIDAWPRDDANGNPIPVYSGIGEAAHCGYWPGYDVRT